MKKTNTNPSITPATITWRDETPHSEAFDDYYFSSEDGIVESTYVFLQRNQLSQRWALWEDVPGRVFTIAETGFGTGLNFLCAWRLWSQQNFQESCLHFISADKFPLQRDDLVKSSEKWPELKPFYEELIEHYPPLVPGFHTIELANGRIRLTLIFSDATMAYEQASGAVDAWFLDGFTPSRNPDMWSEALFAQVARLSHNNTTFSTFTAAGIVRKGLTSAGFDVKKHPGHGPKREICYGKYCKVNTRPEQLMHHQKPWFSEPKPYPTPGTATVIGAGIAGASIARSLANKGWTVRVLEQHPQTAKEGSGNPTGITFTKLSQYDNSQNRFYQLAYLYTTPWLRRLLSSSNFVQGQDWNLNGVVRLAYSEKEKQEQISLVNSGRWPSDIASPLSAQQTTELLGFQCDTPSLLLKQGGWLRPADAVNTLLKHPNITLSCNTQVEKLAPLRLSTASGWQVQIKNAESPTTIPVHTKVDDNDQRRLIRSDIVILANSFGASRFEQTNYLPLRSVRGQVTYVDATEKSLNLKHALNYEGYTAPARDGVHCVGATFHPKAKHHTLDKNDHRTNLQNLTNGLSSFAEALAVKENSSNSRFEGRVAFRCQTPDYLPILGPVPCVDDFVVDYAPLRKGLLRDPMPLGKYHQGLYVSLAHGSRGITSGPYCAEILTNIIMGEIKAADKNVVEALHPARFLIRDIKRRKR